MLTNQGDNDCVTCSLKNAELEERLSAAEKEFAEIYELYSLQQFSSNVRTMAQSSVCPPPPPHPPTPSLISGDPYPLKISQKKESLHQTQELTSRTKMMGIEKAENS